jgi:hypothetical protein
MKRTFALKAILTVITEYAFVDRTYLEELLEFVTNTEGGGLEASPHGLIFAADMCIPVLKDQLPFLSELDLSTLNPDTREWWIAEAILRHGEFHQVTQMEKPLVSSPVDAIVKAAKYFS